MKKMKKYLTIILNSLLLVLVIILVLINHWSKQGNQAPFQLKSVLSGSMAKSYPQGSLLLIKRVRPEMIEVNDVITFQIGQDSVSHRVNQLATKDPRQFVTKGDSNQLVDSQVIGEDELIGKVIAGIPKLGNFLTAAQTKNGRMAVILTLLAIAIADYWVYLLLKE